MKKICLLALLVMSTSLEVQAALNTVTCSELHSSHSTKKEVFIRELENVTDKVSFGKNFDAVYRVEVTVSEIKNSERSVIRGPFEALAKAADVQYNISSIRENGFSFWRYMDEVDQDGMELTLPNGQKQRFNLRCR